MKDFSFNIKLSKFIFGLTFILGIICIVWIVLFPSISNGGINSIIIYPFMYLTLLNWFSKQKKLDVSIPKYKILFKAYNLLYLMFGIFFVLNILNLAYYKIPVQSAKVLILFIPVVIPLIIYCHVCYKYKLFTRNPFKFW